MTTIRVIGGAGYIGAHTCKALAGAGLTPVTFDNLSEGHRDFVRWGPLVQGDIRDRAALDAAIADHAPAAIVHFAALIEVGQSVADPARFYANNIGGSLNIADAARAAGIPVVFSSTCATYGPPQEPTLTEVHPQNPISPYGRTKLVVEWMLRDYSDAYGVRSASLRYFNACGANAGGAIGEAHRTETHLIPRAILARLGKLPEFGIFGTDYDTPDGTAIRDYIHVDDLADAHVRAVRYLLDGGETTQVNIGTGQGYSVRQIVDAVERVSGGPVPVTLGPRRAGDPPALVADTTLARDLLGFVPRHSDLDHIVSTALAWHRRGVNAEA